MRQFELLFCTYCIKAKTDQLRVVTHFQKTIDYFVFMRERLTRMLYMYVHIYIY